MVYSNALLQCPLISKGCAKHRSIHPPPPYPEARQGSRFAFRLHHMADCCGGFLMLTFSAAEGISVQSFWEAGSRY